MDVYQSVIASSRYARYIPELNRRETWAETVDRMVNYLQSKNAGLDKEFKEIGQIYDLGRFVVKELEDLGRSYDLGRT